MCAVANGLTVTGVRPSASSFFVFTDYCRASLRLSAMMDVPVIYICTHDSIRLGEDGPTHHPFEPLASFRAIPGLLVNRPAAATAVVQACRVTMPFRHYTFSLVLPSP